MPAYVAQFVEKVYNYIITNNKGVEIGKNGRKTSTIKKSAQKHEAISLSN